MITKEGELFSEKNKNKFVYNLNYESKAIG